MVVGAAVKPKKPIFELQRKKWRVVNLFLFHISNCDENYENRMNIFSDLPSIHSVPRRRYLVLGPENDHDIKKWKFGIFFFSAIY